MTLSPTWNRSQAAPQDDLQRHLGWGFNPERWPPLWADFAVDWRAEWFGKGNEPPTWYMADDVVDAGLDGILFPSLKPSYFVFLCMA